MKCLSAETTITGPKSDPPIPMFTTSVISFPLKPLCSPEITFSEKTFIWLSTFLIPGFMFSPSTRISLSEKSLKAVCKTALFSVSFIFSPENMALIAAFSCVSSAN